MEWLVGLIVGLTTLVIAIGNLVIAVRDAKRKLKNLYHIRLRSKFH